MKTKLFFRSIALLAAMALTVPAFAKPFAKTINISQNAKLGKSELKAGEYRLQIEGTKATVQKGKNIVAESEGRWEDRQRHGGARRQDDGNRGTKTGFFEVNLDVVDQPSAPRVHLTNHWIDCSSLPSRRDTPRGCVTSTARSC